MIQQGQDAKASDFINKTTKDATPTNNVGKVPLLESNGLLDGDFLPNKVIKKVYSFSSVGDSTTSIDVTVPVAGTTRYTWNGTGTNPNINASTFPVGAQVSIYTPNFANLGDNFVGVVTASGANYFEVANGSGVAEATNTLSDGYLKVNKNVIWTKTAGLKACIVKLVGGGAGGARSNTTSKAFGGGGGSYAEKTFLASDLNATETISVGAGGKRGNYSPVSDAGAGATSTFKSISAGGGNFVVYSSGVPGTGGVATGGDININGGTSFPAKGTSTAGGNSLFGFGAQSRSENAGNYGGGGAGSDNASTGDQGSHGGDGVIIIEEFY